MIRLFGNRILVRDWLETDFERYLGYLRPGMRWQALDGPYYPQPEVEQQRQILDRIARLTASAELPSPRRRLVIANSHDDQLIGTVSWGWESVETRWPTNGIVLYEETDWGQGLGYEALGLWNDYLWGALPDVVRLDLRTWSGNRGMMRLAEKLGYREEARFRKARIVAGKYYDSVGYGVLREEWQALYPAGFAQHLKQEANR